MKRRISIGLLALVCLCASAHTRLTPELVNFVSLHGDLGYSALLTTMPDHKLASGVNPTIGVDYRLFYNNFLFSVGAEAMYQLNAYNIGAFNDTVPMRDTEGTPFRMIAQVGKPRDLTHMVNVNIPILFGGEWGRFYFMVGPKVSLNLYGASSSSAIYETYADYDDAYEDFHDMPNHQLERGQRMSSSTLPLKWKLNVMAHAEIGARINHMFKHKQFRINPDMIRMYLAAYVDYGVLNIYSASANEPSWYEYTPADKGVQFNIRPLMCSTMAIGAKFNNLNVGIKYTIAFEMPTHGKSYIYDSDKVDRNYRTRGGNQSLK